MALELQICAQETCDELVYRDITGTYNATTQPGGYGPENDVLGPEDFDTYVVSIWGPNTDPSTTAPLLVKDLLLSIPEPDENGYYSWTITATALGLTTITSGVWYMEAVATLDDTIYEADNSPILLRDVKTTIVDPAMLGADIDCGCKEGCSDPFEIFAKYQAVACNGVCSAEQTQSIITWLYSQCVEC